MTLYSDSTTTNFLEMVCGALNILYAGGPATLPNEDWMLIRPDWVRAG
jgi:hypothetical protein